MFIHESCKTEIHMYMYGTLNWTYINLNFKLSTYVCFNL